MRISIVFIAAVVFFVEPLSASHFKFVSANFPPFVYAESNGVVKGWVVSRINKVMAMLGHSFEIEIHPWPRSLRMIAVGKADGILGACKTSEGDLCLDYSNLALFSMKIALYVLKDSPLAFDGDLLKLKDKHIGVVSTISYGDRFERLRDQLKIYRVNRLDLNFKKLKRNRVDLVVADVQMAEYVIEKLGMGSDFRPLKPLIQTVNGFIAFSKARSHTRLRDQLDLGLRLVSRKSVEFDLSKKPLQIESCSYR